MLRIYSDDLFHEYKFCIHTGSPIIGVFSSINMKYADEYVLYANGNYHHSGNSTPTLATIWLDDVIKRVYFSYWNSRSEKKEQSYVDYDTEYGKYLYKHISILFFEAALLGLRDEV